MTSQNYCLSWESYKNNICNGFAQLQQKGEFVDMTLVAEGHIVRVHKNLISLASPYIKNIIKAAPCDHPIIFLFNLSHSVLCQILEYVYTGEVHVDNENLDEFIKAAKELQLPGITEDLHFKTSLSYEQNSDSQKALSNETKIQILEDRVLGYGTSEAALKTNSTLDANMVSSQNDNNDDVAEIDRIDTFDDFIKFPEPPNLIPHETSRSGQCSDEMGEINCSMQGDKQHEIEFQIDLTESIPQQYTLSNRGSLQMILNRYLYNMHHSAWSGQKRRWRCIDYRLLHCMAYVDTVNDKITERINIHNHSFHDEKIMKKISNKLVFGALSTALFKATKINDKSEENIDTD